MKRKQGTFNQEITEMLTYYHAVAQRGATPKVEDEAPRERRAGAPLRVVPIKATVSRTHPTDFPRAAE